MRFLILLTLAACAACATNPPPEPTATTIPTPSATASASASAVPSAPAEPGSPAAFQACAADADCVAVPKLGCCQNGRMEAIASTKVDAYKASFTCPPPKPMCPMYMVLETRQPECNDGTRLCEMVPIEKIQCATAAKHKCPDGYACKQGTCTK